MPKGKFSDAPGKHFIGDVWKKANLFQGPEVKEVPRWGHDWLTMGELAVRAGIHRLMLLRWVKRGILPMPRRGWWRKKRLPVRFTDEYCEAFRQCVITRRSAVGMYYDWVEFRKLCHTTLKRLAVKVTPEMAEANLTRFLIQRGGFKIKSPDRALVRKD